MSLELPTLFDVRPTSSSSFVDGILDEMKEDHIELRATLRQLRSLLQKSEWRALRHITSEQIRSLCEISRILHEKVLGITCAKRVDIESAIDLKAAITEAIDLHDQFLSLDVVEKYIHAPRVESLPLLGKELRYLQNIKDRRNLLIKLSEKPPTVLGSLSGSVKLRENAQRGQLLNASTEVWNHLLWLTEYFRLRIDAERTELGHEVDSLYDSGHYHREVLKNIGEFVCHGFQLLKTNGATEILESPAFLAIANTVEACALHAGELNEDLLVLLTAKVSGDSEGRFFQKRQELCEDLVEISLILTSISKQLLDRAPFVKLRGVTKPSPLELRVITYPSIDGKGMFIAQCLDIDLVAAALGEESAIERLSGMLQAWLKEISSAKDNMLHPTVAPANFHAAFADAGPSIRHKCEGAVLMVRRSSATVEASYRLTRKALLEASEEIIERAF